MEKQTIKIKAIDMYHPDNKVENAGYINHYKERGRDISHLLEVMGKKERFIINNPEESGLTMAIEASKKVLKKANLKGKDIDMIVYSTQVPEQTVPTNAVLIHEAIEGASHSIVMDSNANCSGMTLAVEQTSRYMLSNPHVHTALVIGSDHLSLISNPEDEITYSMYGDASCAVILEKTEEDGGFIDAMHHTYTGQIDKIKYPVEGLAKTLRGEVKPDARFIRFTPFDASFGTPIIFQLIEDVLKRNDMRIDDIDAFCLSQFAYGDTLKIQERFDIHPDKLIYVGDRFGYTGTTSPFMAMYEGIECGRIKRGDQILFWTVGAGHQFIVMLFQY